MSTLTETSFYTRKLINLSLILVAVGVVIRFVILGASGLYDALFPKPPPSATNAFGQLPMPNAQNNIATPTASLTYSLETADGGLPMVPFTIRVYFIPHANSSFGSFENMKSTASNLGFIDTPQRITNTASTNEAIAGEAQGFFDKAGILPPEFKGGSTIISYYKFDSGALVQTTAIANADAVSVTLNRSNIDSGDKKLDKIGVVSPDYKQGLVSVLFSGSSDAKKRVLETRFLVSPIDLENWATYTPLSAQEAWVNLQAGKAIYASLPNPMSSTIVIRKVHLAYLDPYPAQSFLQPVLVFSDEKGFVAYVPLTAK
ncbi:hypothetical protein HY310_03200 [Candidatus Microgenomates bacterium]|nr:hypothetical protein [Candidatus Microgenomates bacterium]